MPTDPRGGGLELAARRAREYLLSGAAGPVERELARMQVERRPVEPAVRARVAADQLPDGSWKAGLGATARALLVLRLLATERDETVQAGVAWMRQRRRSDASFVGGCDPERHAASLCAHRAGGFFAPTPSDGEPPTCWLLGTRLEGRPAALALSCMALTAEAAWQAAELDAQLHAQVLRRLALERGSWMPPRSEPPAAFLAVIRALLELGGDDAAAWHGVMMVLRSQRGDGSWPEVDTFLVLDVLLRAAAAGYGGPSLDRSVRRAAELLAVTQRPDGGWGADLPGSSEEAAAFGLTRDLIGWRALSYSTEAPSEPASIH